MRQIAGFGTGEDTNARFHYLIAQGQTGLSTDFDMPTLMGYDSDHAMSEGEVGREGVAVDVGDGKLAEKLRNDSRVSVLERTNARHLTPSDVPAGIELVTLDVSFISARLLKRPVSCA